AGNQVRYRANHAAPFYPELAEIFRKASVFAEKTAKAPKAQRRRKAEPVAHTLHSPRAEYSAQPATGTLAPPLAKLKRLCRKYGINRLALFGSAARGEMTPDSDVDLLVEFSPDSKVSLFDIPAMQDAFSAVFSGRKVDIVTPEILENTYRRKTILRDARVLYAA
ncbi:nucleotidyltransferase family protein, partial [Candidatus Binatia bacterium]|nr:nucleotidyltransferase family protein [Candidatus Binatia bacterium]